MLHLKAHTICNFESVVFGVFCGFVFCFYGDFVFGFLEVLFCFVLVFLFFWFFDTLNLNAILFLHCKVFLLIQLLFSCAVYEMLLVG